MEARSESEGALNWGIVRSKWGRWGGGVGGR